MAIWKETTPSKSSPAPSPASTPEPAQFDPSPVRDISPATPASTPSPTPAPASTPQRAGDTQLKESLIAADLTIEGKIEGTGHVRIAGKFNGDVNVQGNLTIETGAKLTGGVRAQTVIIAGELEGNIESAQKVEVLASGALIGDVKAGSLTVAAGSRMRGQVEFGWGDKHSGGKSGGGKTGTDDAA
ncbi:polymer-forming cytoskeletal protein [Lysobacter sp. F60174L2]|uniref:polymer-forming cytoskeletal protein n=1 Tax=Lysobacter sp. F60174L2 TaxID=3459295 RepID=UPI00403D672C